MSPTDRLVWLALLNRANPEGVCWPKVATIAEFTGLDERTVRRALIHLTDVGEVSVTRSGRASTYMIEAFGRVPSAVTVTDQIGHSARSDRTQRPLYRSRTRSNQQGAFTDHHGSTFLPGTGWI
jgi:hypothetical protein